MKIPDKVKKLIASDNKIKAEPMSREIVKKIMAIKIKMDAHEQGDRVYIGFVNGWYSGVVTKTGRVAKPTKGGDGGNTLYTVEIKGHPGKIKDVRHTQLRAIPEDKIHIDTLFEAFQAHQLAVLMATREGDYKRSTYTALQKRFRESIGEKLASEIDWTEPR